MKRLILIALLIFSFQYAVSQNDTIYLMVEDVSIQSRIGQELSWGFLVKSHDDRFICDYYKFQIPNWMGIDEKGEDIFFNADQLKKGIDLDSIHFETISSFILNKKPWEIHNELSLIKEIFIIGRQNGNYYFLPLIYEGTRKNIIPTDLSFDNKG
ncbi:MAG TPA: hypothetical protein VFM70_03015 [Salinimicrobium sp.]|nr:hypothetical protein [Salinimicrobium sp.]